MGILGAFGVEQDRRDKNAFGWDEKEVLAKHTSQKGFLLFISLNKYL